MQVHEGGIEGGHRTSGSTRDHQPRSPAHGPKGRDLLPTHEADQRQSSRGPLSTGLADHVSVRRLISPQ